MAYLIHFPKSLNIEEIINNDSELTISEKKSLLKNKQRVLFIISLCLFRDESLKFHSVEKVSGFKYLLNFLVRNKILLRIKPQTKYLYRLHHQYINDYIIWEELSDKRILSFLENEASQTITEKNILNNQVKIDYNKIYKGFMRFTPLKILHNNIDSDDLFNFFAEIINNDLISLNNIQEFNYSVFITTFLLESEIPLRLN